MFDINGKFFLDVKFEGFDGITNKNFIDLKLVEYEGLKIPIFEMNLFQVNLSLYEFIIKANLDIDITLGSSQDEFESYEFSLLNYKFTSIKEGYNLLLTGLLRVKDFTNKPLIYSKKGTSDVILKDCKGLTPDVQYKGVDEQVWIRYGNSEKSFFEDTISHCYISDDDLVLSAVTLEKKLRAISYKTEVEKDIDIRFKQEKLGVDPEAIRYDEFVLESNSGLYSNFVSEGRELSIFDINGRKSDIKKLSALSMKDGKEYDIQNENVKYYPILNCGNCHENYFQAFLNNLNNSVKLIRNNLYVYTSSKVLLCKDLNILDIVNFIPTDKRFFNFGGDGLAGKYVVTEKFISLDSEGVTQRFKLNRDFFL